MGRRVMQIHERKTMFGSIGLGSIFGIEVRQAPFPLERQVPKQLHKKKRGQTEAYHRRIQKKWTKRYGTKTERYALMMNPRAAGLVGGPAYLLDQRDMAMLKGFTA